MNPLSAPQGKANIRLHHSPELRALQMIATRDISAGEELTMCYVDENADVKTRRAELADYGFTCRCAKCERQDAGLGQPRRGSKTK